jgi:hypothetical protein
MQPALLLFLLLLFLLLFLLSFRSVGGSATAYVVKPILSATYWIPVTDC